MEKSRLIRPTGRLSWMPDPEFSLKFQPKYGDYDNPRRFELGHGHLATAFLHPHQQGFYLTNSVPQLDQVNGGHWRVIEEYISCLTRRVEETFIYTGPLFLPNEKTNLMEFQVLGPKEIFVPTHLFKVVLLKISDKDGWKYWLESYVITNTNLDELFDEKQKTPARPYNDGSYETVQECRRNPYFLKFQGVSPRKHIQDLLNHYRKPFKFIEKYSDIRLFDLLSDEIKEIKDGVLFDMERVVKKKEGKKKVNEYFGKIENFNEKEILEVKKVKENVKAKNNKNKKNKSGNNKGQIKTTKEEDSKGAETKNLEKELTNTSSISANQEEISTNNTKKISNDSVIEKILEKSESADLKSDLTPTPSLTKSESSENFCIIGIRDDPNSMCTIILFARQDIKILLIINNFIQ
uniref:ENPP1-3/EXOG-like endonuclease/phosphodiesterase domain-containing protein n=1 Tax=Meloidogyne enterolobii TaxID=390850 RepID=A0A6V7VAH5_MELEN|nr:unnamed protein product [Meloidogyne enterolobii]